MQASAQPSVRIDPMQFDESAVARSSDVIIIALVSTARSVDVLNRFGIYAEQTARLMRGEKRATFPTGGVGD